MGPRRPGGSLRDQAEAIGGPTVQLTDVEDFVAFARFSDPRGRIWNVFENKMIRRCGKS